MAKMLNCRNWIISPLLSAACVLIIFLHSAGAALLRDIRVGEYEGFTRIVFELDAPIDPVQIVPMLPRQLAMVFSGTSAELVRKIPVERSRHLKNIQIWNKKDQLSVVLTLDHDNFRHEIFPLKNPPRIVLDIQPLKSAPMMTSAPSGTQGVVPDSADGSTSDTHPDEAEESAQPAHTTDISQAREKSDLGAFQQIPRERQRTIEPTRSPATESHSAKLSESTGTAKTDVPKTFTPQSSRLQYFLVIALVLITIVILALLLLMLLSKHRWAVDKSRLSAKESLQNQDKHIASLDARIQEQLKRFEEI